MGFISDKKSGLLVYIDDMYLYRGKHEIIIIRGWTFSITNSKEVEININEDLSKYSQIIRSKRNDVYQKYNNHYHSRNSGFTVLIFTDGIRDKEIQLNFCDRSKEITFSKNIDEIKNNYTKILSSDNLKKVLSNINKNGFKFTYEKIKGSLIKKSFNFKDCRLPRDVQYKIWLSKEMNNYEDKDENLEYNPLISIILPVFNVEEKFLRECIESVLNQKYSNWQLCISDDNSTKEHIRDVLNEYNSKDDRINVIFREENGHISHNSNTALTLAIGEFIALLDHDDLLATNALLEVVKLLNKNKEADLIYSDEDKITSYGERIDPFFKPDWSPDLLLSCNYITHLSVFRKSIIDNIGGFRVGCEGSQDYDLLLRFTKKTNNIFHIPKILYHWRMIEGSTALDSDNKSYAYDAAIKSLRDHYQEKNIQAKISKVKGYNGYYHTKFPTDNNTLVSILIDSSNPEHLKKCLNSIYKNTYHKHFEVVVATTNNQEAIKLCGKYNGKKDFHHIEKCNSILPNQIYNKLIKTSKGQVILIISEKLIVSNNKWLNDMLSYALKKTTGVVGAITYYRNIIKQAGIILKPQQIIHNSHFGYLKNSPGFMGRLLTPSNYTTISYDCFMFKREHYDLLKGFNKKTGPYFNIDFCLRLLEKGFYNVVLPQVKLKYHSNPEYHNYQSKYKKTITKLWSNYIQEDPYYNKNLSLIFEDFSYDVDSLYERKVKVASRKS